MNQDLWAVHRLLLQFEKSKSLSDFLFDRLFGVYAIVDLSGRVFRTNNEGASLFGTDLEDALGKNICNLFALPSENVRKKLEEAASTGQTIEFEAALADAESGERSFQWTFRPLEVSGNTSLGKLVFVIGRDVSELKTAMRSLFEVEKDLDFAREVQNLLLPPADLLSAPGWSMAAHYEPAAKAGGDWWRCEPRPDGSVLFLLGDVTGHGAGAGMVTAMVSGGYSALVKEGGNRDVPAILEGLNRLLREVRGQSHWMTMFGIEMFPSRNEVKWYCAAAPSGSVLRGSGEIEMIGGIGQPLGAGDLDFASGTARFETGDRLFFATDGLWEIHPSVGAKVLKKKFHDILKTRHGKPSEARAALMAEWREWARRYKPNDDVAFLIVDRL